MPSLDVSVNIYLVVMLYNDTTTFLVVHQSSVIYSPHFGLHSSCERHLCPHINLYYKSKIYYKLTNYNYNLFLVIKNFKNLSLIIQLSTQKFNH